MLLAIFNTKIDNKQIIPYKQAPKSLFTDKKTD